MMLDYLRDKAFDRVCRSMRLRKPQKDALEAYHKIFKTLPNKLSQCDHALVKQIFREEFPRWHFEGPCPEITFHLATGVGKTRLIGAIMAYLYLAQESEHFIVVTPRSEIIRKFIRECQPADPKYIFVDRTVVEEPEIINAENVGYFEPTQGRVFAGPIIWVLSPQALSVPNSKLKQKTAHAKQSPVDYLKGLKDSIIFFDESHHLGPKDVKDSSVWRREIRQLGSKFIFGTTASVDSEDDNHNVLYSYDIKQCLNDGLYTKAVRVIPEKVDSTMKSDDRDKMTLRYGLRRLGIKQAALNDYAKRRGDSQPKKAVMLVCCDTKDSAEDASAFLENMPELKKSVLLVHSGRSESHYLEDLLSLEDKANTKKVVVNVSMLSEGWDVSNVYVIVPLRAMASSTLVTQVMGRGLRLPFGKQVGMQEVDTLDILCFGRETMQEVCDKILQQGFGLNRGLTVQQAPNNKENPEEEYTPSVKVILNNKSPLKSIKIPNIRMEREQFDCNEVDLPSLSKSDMRAFKINDPQTIEILKGRPAFARSEFIDIVTTNLLRKCKQYLSHQLHDDQVRAMIERFLTASELIGTNIALEPEAVVVHMKKHLDDLSRQMKHKYVKAPGEEIIKLDKVEIYVPGHFAKPTDSANVDAAVWESTRGHYKGLLLSGWRRCIFEAVPFDQPNEVGLAKVIDRSSEVTWWFRNLPNIFYLSTPVGRYAPDFAMLLKTRSETILLEVKGEVFAVGDDSDSIIKAKAAQEWCQAMSEASKSKWTYWFILDKDAARCQDFQDIKRYAEESSDIE